MKHGALLLLALAGLAACGGGSELPTAAPSPSPAAVALEWRWRAVRPLSGPLPEPRSHGVAVYDPVLRRLVVFGGKGEQALLNDVWAFSLAASTWSALPTVGMPPEPRLGANAVYDPNAHQMILWAGQQGSRFFDDTWTLDLRTLQWRDVSPAQRPQARYGSAAVFDPVERRLVQFAGFTSLFRRFKDTQAFDLDTLGWEDLTPAQGGPEVRCLVTGALHAPSRRMIVYGGQQAGPIDDIWAFDLGSRQWADLTPASRPAGRMLASSFMDRDGRFVVFGGATTGGAVNETWSFDLPGRQWTRLEPRDPPPPRAAAQATLAEDERFLVFGGEGDRLLNDLWELVRVPAGS